MSINPIELKGNWDRGYALDIHTTSSTPYLDESGQLRFENEYSVLGKALNQFKYHKNSEKFFEIMELIKPFLNRWVDMRLVEIVIPVPPSRKERKYQPSEAIAFEISKCLNVQYCATILSNTSDREAKLTTRPSGSIAMNQMLDRKYNILLVDDLYNTGGTLRQCVDVLKKSGVANLVFVLTITKTRTGGLR